MLFARRLRLHTPPFRGRVLLLGGALTALAGCGPSAEEVDALRTDIAGEVDSALVADAQWQATLTSLFDDGVSLGDEPCPTDWSGDLSALGQVGQAESDTLRSAQVSARLAALDAVGADLMIATSLDEAALAELRSQFAAAPPLTGAEPLLLTRGLGYPRFEDGVFTPGSLQATMVLVDLSTMSVVCGAEINATNSPNAVAESQAADADGFAASPGALLLADLYHVASEAVVLRQVAGAP